VIAPRTRSQCKMSAFGGRRALCISRRLQLMQNPLMMRLPLAQLNLSSFVFVILFGIDAEKQLYAGDKA
jgi:hypothetical protein